jgi:shikimate dehydrogenase
MKKYGLIGYPLSQSFSKDFFTNKFQNNKIDAEYLNFELESIGEFPEIIDENPELMGFNVTIPYKEKILPFLTNLDKEAEKVMAVNTVKIEMNFEEKQLVGYNTDISGFEETLKNYLQKHHSKALILGTGGASKAVKYVLEKLGIEYIFASRGKERGYLTYKELCDDIIAEHTLIVNTTPLGMFPDIDSYPVLPYNAITDKHLCYDLIYNPSETVFLKKSKEQGAVIVNGKEMLIKQAEKSWEIWNM